MTAEPIQRMAIPLDYKHIDTSRLTDYPDWLLLEQAQSVEGGNGYAIVVEILKRFAKDVKDVSPDERKETIRNLNRKALGRP